MKRREFIALVGGAAVGWSLTARAQSVKMRRIGVLTSLEPGDSQAQARIAAFHQGLGQLGWNVGRNLQIDYRWGGGNAARYPQDAAELIALTPEVILAAGGSVVGPLQQVTRTVPIVFILVTDPVGSGYVASLARPGGNATGFTEWEFGISAKWIEILKQIAPGVTRAAVLSDFPSQPAGFGQLGAMQSVAPSLGIEISPLNVRDAPDIERAVVGFVRGSNDGLLVLPSGPTTLHRDLIIKLASQYKLPAVYPFTFYVTGGGLICYGPDELEQFRQAAGYVDRILKGEKPADLPVQAPSKYVTMINLKTAKALGLSIVPNLLATADEVIE
jgi:putative ABC transport system substrate-binding protein